MALSTTNVAIRFSVLTAFTTSTCLVSPKCFSRNSEKALIILSLSIITLLLGSFRQELSSDCPPLHHLVQQGRQGMLQQLPYQHSWSYQYAERLLGVRSLVCLGMYCYHHALVDQLAYE